MPIDEGPSPEDIERFSDDTGYCPECGEEIWDGMDVCPQCGAAMQGGTRHRPPMDAWFRQRWVIVIAIITIVGFLLGCALKGFGILIF